MRYSSCALILIADVTSPSLFHRALFDIHSKISYLLAMRSYTSVCAMEKVRRDWFASCTHNSLSGNIPMRKM